MIDRRHSIHCIVPPHMMKHIIGKADPQLRAALLNSLSVEERIRGRREIMSMLPLGTPTGEKRRTIFDAHGQWIQPGDLVRGEGDPATSDPAVNEAFDGLGATYDLFFDEYCRNSIDDRGMRLDATVHYGTDFNNAFWDGRQMVFGDGDGQIFVGFTKAIDVIGHELTHGVTQFEAALVYEYQSGALNESFSDVFGSLVKQRTLNQSAEEADWLIGHGILGPSIQGQALRSMKEPGTAYDDPLLGKDPQPGHMKGYVNTAADNGGVHINSGIPNHAFYFAAMGMGGYAWEDAGQIWYLALRRLQPMSQFQEAADVTHQAAGELFGTGSEQQRTVRDAWSQVGIRVAGCRASRTSSRRDSAESQAGEYSSQVEKLTEEVKDLRRMFGDLTKRLESPAKR